MDEIKDGTPAAKACEDMAELFLRGMGMADSGKPCPRCGMYTVEPHPANLDCTKHPGR